MCGCDRVKGRGRHGTPLAREALDWYDPYAQSMEFVAGRFWQNPTPFLPIVELFIEGHNKPDLRLKHHLRINDLF